MTEHNIGPNSSPAFQLHMFGGTLPLFGLQPFTATYVAWLDEDDNEITVAEPGQSVRFVAIAVVDEPESNGLATINQRPNFFYPTSWSHTPDNPFPSDLPVVYQQDDVIVLGETNPIPAVGEGLILVYEGQFFGTGEQTFSVTLETAQSGPVTLTASVAVLGTAVLWVDSETAEPLTVSTVGDNVSAGAGTAAVSAFTNNSMTVNEISDGFDWETFVINGPPLLDPPVPAFDGAVLPLGDSVVDGDTYVSSMGFIGQITEPGYKTLAVTFDTDEFVGETAQGTILAVENPTWATAFWLNAQTGQIVTDGVYDDGDEYVFAALVYYDSVQDNATISITDAPDDFTVTKWAHTPDSVSFWDPDTYLNIDDLARPLPAIYEQGDTINAGDSTTFIQNFATNGVFIVWRGTFAGAGEKTFGVSIDTDQSGPITASATLTLKYSSVDTAIALWYDPDTQAPVTSVPVGEPVGFAAFIVTHGPDTGATITINQSPDGFLPTTWIHTPQTTTPSAGPIKFREGEVISVGNTVSHPGIGANTVFISFIGTFARKGVKLFNVTMSTDLLSPSESLVADLSVYNEPSPSITGTPRKVTVDLLSKSGTLLADNLAITGGYWTDEQSDAGAAEVTIPNLAYAPSLLAVEDTLLRFSVDDVPDRTALIEKVKVTVRSTNPQDRLRVLTGRDWLCEFTDALVDPPLGLNSYPAASTVRFDWTHPQLDRSNWTNPYFIGSLFKGQEAFGQPLAPPYVGKVGQAPKGWPDILTGWIWSEPPSGPPTYSHPLGTSYFYFSINIGPAGANKALIPVFTADDFGQLAFDGAVIDAGAEFPAVQWQNCTASGIPSVSQGQHYFCAKVENAEWTQYGGNYNVGSMAFALYQPIVSTFFQYENLIARTGAWIGQPNPIYGGGWKCLNRPAQAPGFTIGKAFRLLFQAAQASGHLQGWTLGFTDTRDSAGNLWPVTEELTARVNDPLLDVMRQWHDQGQWDFAARADRRVLDGWIWQGRGNFSANNGALLWDDDRLTTLSIDGER